MFNRGDFVLLNNQIGVVAFTGAELKRDLADHTGVWFGEADGARPVIWTVPTEYLSAASEPDFKH